MAALVPDPKRIKSFKTESDFETWLSKHHDTEPEIWIKIHKKASGLASITAQQAIDVVLCWGWIDGQRQGFDETSFLQRYTPRRKKSAWSQINRDNVARLTAAGKMTPHGQREVDAAKSDGRWDAAYAPMRLATTSSMPADLRAAIEANPRAKKTFDSLNKANLFALAYRTNNMKTVEGRKRKIAELVAMLARGESIAATPATSPRPAPIKKPAKKQRAKKRPRQGRRLRGGPGS